MLRPRAARSARRRSVVRGSAGRKAASMKAVLGVRAPPPW
jgi:hypothetical protein